MKIERNIKSNVTADYEDRGLFKTSPSRLEVSLVPKIWNNNRDDILIRGLVFDEIEVEVLFAGRRRDAAAPLVEHIRTIWSKANHNQPAGAAPVEIDDVRYPVLISGSWRVRFEMDKSDWQTRHYQLVVAHWSPANSDEDGAIVGEPPLIPDGR